jgi:hypothetical protein
MQRAPRDPRKGIGNRRFLVHIMLSGTLIVFGSLAVFWHARSTGSSVEPARTIGFTTPAAGSSRFNHPDRVHSADKNNREAHQTFLKYQPGGDPEVEGAFGNKSTIFRCLSLEGISFPFLYIYGEIFYDMPSVVVKPSNTLVLSGY